MEHDGKLLAVFCLVLRLRQAIFLNMNAISFVSVGNFFEHLTPKVTIFCRKASNLNSLVSKFSKWFFATPTV